MRDFHRTDTVERQLDLRSVHLKGIPVSGSEWRNASTSRALFFSNKTSASTAPILRFGLRHDFQLAAATPGLNAYNGQTSTRLNRMGPSHVYTIPKTN